MENDVMKKSLTQNLGFYIGQAWLILLLAGVFGSALALVDLSFSSRIASNKLNDTMNQIPSLVPGASTGEKADNTGDLLVYKALNQQGACMGYVIQAAAQGFADKVEVLIGVDEQVASVTGIYVLDQKETPGLGNKITDVSWRDQFKAKPVSPFLTVVKRMPRTDHEIEAVTGATISSDCVVGIVNRYVAKFKAIKNEKGI